MDNLYVVEYSTKQNAFHVSTVKEMIRNNFDQFVQFRAVNDYVPLFIGSEEKAREVCTKLKQLRDKPVFAPKPPPEKRYNKQCII